MSRYYSSSRYRKPQSRASHANRFWVWSTIVLLLLFIGTIFFTMKGKPDGEGFDINANQSEAAAEEQIANENTNKALSNKNTNASNTNTAKPIAIKAYISIIIDDLGNQSPDAAPTKTLLATKAPITFSVIPERAKSKEIAAAAKTAGFEVIIHQPMEPVNPALSAGDGSILSTMSDAQAAQIIDKHVAEIPEAIGMNNHMGSKVTQDPELVRAIMKKLKAKGFFFVDSFTISTSKGFAVAKEEDVKTARRSVFIDGEDNEAYIRGKILELANTALEKRIVVPIGIGHIRAKTVAVLQDMLPELAAMGVGLKKLSEVVE
ncbi:MAG TPA: divergent polysaccharide deacetylase family protein [Patescibacteria group bacterium]|nr:divergent polysaccharide deacetylase family protein [Patescibacteria group bacterium]